MIDLGVYRDHNRWPGIADAIVDGVTRLEQTLHPHLAKLLKVTIGTDSAKSEGGNMLQGIFGNASEVDVKGIQADLSAILVDGEIVVRAFRIIRDMFVFTDKRLILIDKQGMTGKKAEYHTIPYKSISHFSVETAGTFDMDAELKIYISGNMTPYEREFKKGADIKGVQKTLAQFILR